MRWTAHSQPATSENQGVNLAVSGYQYKCSEVSSGSDANREVMSRRGRHGTLARMGAMASNIRTVICTEYRLLLSSLTGACKR